MKLTMTKEKQGIRVNGDLGLNDAYVLFISVFVNNCLIKGLEKSLKSTEPLIISIDKEHKNFLNMFKNFLETKNADEEKINKIDGLEIIKEESGQFKINKELDNSDIAFILSMIAKAAAKDDNAKAEEIVKSMVKDLEISLANKTIGVRDENKTNDNRDSKSVPGGDNK